MIEKKHLLITSQEHVMDSIAQVEHALNTILQERANILARETGCIIRQRKFTGASLAQTLIFSWHQHPQASLEQLASTAEIAAVSVTDTAVENRFTPACAEFWRRLLEELSAVVVEAVEPVALPLLGRFGAVILEDRRVIPLPSALHEVWPGCGNQHEDQAASLKLHVRWELQRGRLDGPALSAGRVSDRCSPWQQAARAAGALYVQDLGYFSLQRIAERKLAGAFSLSRLHAGTLVLDRQGQTLNLRKLAPKQVGQTKEVPVLVGAKQRLPMRLLLLRVPKDVADERRARQQAEAKRRGQTVSAETLA
jgi:hypothetical protein